MADQSLISLFPSAASSAYVINFQCPKISHFNFNFQSDRINVKVGKNLKTYHIILMIKSNVSTITKCCKRQSYEDALWQAVELFSFIMIIINKSNGNS